MNKESEDEIRKHVDQLEQIIKDSQKELELIKESCQHPQEHRKIKNIQPDGGAAVRITCGLCNGIIGYPSNEELDEWMDL